MTDNIQKLYEIAGVKPLCQIPDGYCGMKNVYSDFSAEKQLKLIKWLGKFAPFNISFSIDAWYIKVVSKNKNLDYLRVNNYFDNGLVDLIIDLWQDLSDDQKQEIKDILK